MRAVSHSNRSRTGAGGWSVGADPHQATDLGLKRKERRMSSSAMLRRPVRFWQDAEKVRQRRSRKTLPPHRLGGVHKRDARYSARREPQRLTVRPRDKSLSWQARGGRVRMNDSASSLAAALPDRLSQQPAGYPCSIGGPAQNFLSAHSHRSPTDSFRRLAPRLRNALHATPPTSESD